MRPPPSSGIHHHPACYFASGGTHSRQHQMLRASKLVRRVIHNFHRAERKISLHFCDCARGPHGVVVSIGVLTRRLIITSLLSGHASKGEADDGCRWVCKKAWRERACWRQPTTSQPLSIQNCCFKKSTLFLCRLVVVLNVWFFFKSNYVTSAAAVEWPLFLLDCRRSWWHSQHAGTLKPRSS